MKWKAPMREVLISRIGGVTGITPTDMDGTVHHSMTLAQDIELILVYWGATTAHIVDGNVCIRGHRLIIDVEIVQGKCLVVNVWDGDKP